MFHENLKAQRKLKGFTQETLAIKTGVVRQTVSKWEKGLSVPDADTLQQLAEVLEVTVSQLLGADAPDSPETRNETAEQLARINEQLAIQNRRARRVWKGVLIVLITVIVIPSLLLVFLGVCRYAGTWSQEEIAGTTEWICTLDGEDYVYRIEYDDQYQIQTAGGSAYIADHSDAELYDDANQLAAHIKDYFKDRGGQVSVNFQEGLELNE